MTGLVEQFMSWVRGPIAMVLVGLSTFIIGNSLLGARFRCILPVQAYGLSDLSPIYALKGALDYPFYHNKVVHCDAAYLTILPWSPILRGALSAHEQAKRCGSVLYQHRRPEAASMVPPQGRGSEGERYMRLFRS